MKIKNIIIAAFLIICLQNCALAKTTMEKVQRGADIYFKITDRLELSLSQQRKAFGIKLEEAVHLVPLLNDIKVNEEKLNTLLSDSKKDNEEEIKNLNNTIELQKAVASQKKRYYISRYRGILTQEQNYKLDELIFDIANGYLKL
ncbi:TPA: hypothetical protein IAA68_04615 [Candidatus Galligastranaerophilus faecipullorum]|nr:hypothetical protein [Candidatus Galligastranaerophilus faecipullorum]